MSGWVVDGGPPWVVERRETQKKTGALTLCTGASLYWRRNTQRQVRGHSTQRWKHGVPWADTGDMELYYFHHLEILEQFEREHNLPDFYRQFLNTSLAAFS
jgi:hypothetical protein